MMASAPEYNKYATDVLGPKLDPNIYKQIMDIEKNNDFKNPKYSKDRKSVV